MKKIAVAADHAGYALKQGIIGFLEKKGYEVKDAGTSGEESVDYPDYVHILASYIKDGSADMGIVICGSGNGVNITANRYPFIRSGLAWNKEVAALIRQHNDANVIALPARFIDQPTAEELVEIFLRTDFEGGRHQRRVDKINP